jgi:hypothetical protein
MKLEYARDLVAASWELDLIEDYQGEGAAVRFKRIGGLLASIGEAVTNRRAFGDPVFGFIDQMSNLTLVYPEGTGVKHIAAQGGIAV